MGSKDAYDFVLSTSVGNYTRRSKSRDQSYLTKVLHKWFFCAEILEQSKGARIRVGKRLSYRPARLHRLADRCDNSVPNWFLAPIDCFKIPALSSIVRAS